ncbi:Zn-dependent alcohol dehydrogenase [Conexibacter sp. JD483]|uniref:Zn-dependent alcohol dehydrogenase n=1 Tax=unclassified Conexibacter TaxID=2627773 RepID=UPI00271D340A|nr:MULTISPECIES: Zn-dependent alcohol dehydrogenase [unclassified Conexibacter]MDO8187091.1 Zn-dependent alcohol dehydrogenase [Conexibacter sp. CPCC 205706]MDO8200949.1 Zn-dependent alcohol dehydrogenase [Conexibacter sp. CPCC 205762]MDR9372229.1 Zn-dependent alcohol dehydrogenase [Conexibacter sp. JD483]
MSVSLNETSQTAGTTLEVDVPVLVATGRPLEIQRLTVDPPQAGEVRIQMAASGVCHSCLHAVDGSHEGLPLPLVLGDEGAGTIESVGTGVVGLAPGDRVIISWAPGCGRCRSCQAGKPGVCLDPPPFGGGIDGTPRFHRDGEPVHHYGPATYAPYTVIPARGAIKLPDAMPLELAALVGCAVTTGCGGVLNAARVRAGESVAVFGCGGIGLSAVLGAVVAGATPIVGVDTRAAKLDYARELGATLTVDASAGDPAEQIKALVPGGVDHAIVAVGDATAVEQAFAALAVGGTCVLLGNPPTRTKPIELPPHQLLVGERTLVGSVYGSSNPPLDFPRFVDLHLAGRLPLDRLVTRRYPLDEADQAFADLAAGELARGLIVF